MSTSQDCPHAPACRAGLGCCHEYPAVPHSWAVLVVERDGAYLARTWEHPRFAVTHRSEAGEPMDAAPLWAR